MSLGRTTHYLCVNCMIGIPDSMSICLSAHSVTLLPGGIFREIVETNEGLGLVMSEPVLQSEREAGASSQPWGREAMDVLCTHGLGFCFNWVTSVLCNCGQTFYLKWGFFVCFGCFKLKNNRAVLQHRVLLNFSSFSMHKKFQQVKSGPLTEITDLWTILLTVKPQIFSPTALRVWHIHQANLSSALVPVITLWVCVSFHHPSSGINAEEWG